MADLTITDLDPAVVQQNESFLVSFLHGAFPSMNLSVGSVLRQLLIEPAAIFYTLNKTNLATVQNSQSMLNVIADPAGADPALVNAILSNFRIVRNPGTVVNGIVTIILNDLLTTTVDQGTVFTANGLNYLTQQTHVGVIDPGSILTNQQRLITARTDGTFIFTVPVVAENVGASYRARQNTRFTAVPAVSDAIDYVASADFTGGSDAQTNQDMVNLFKQSLSAQVFSGRTNIEAILRLTLPTLLNLSTIGFGDAEMVRDRHNIFSMSTGGKSDIYVRTQDFPEAIVVSKTATLIDVGKQLWQISISRNDAPGFYTIQGVRQPTTPLIDGSLEITGETRGFDPSQNTNEFVPAITNVVESAYTRYQTAIIQFVDPSVDYTALVVGATATYSVQILRLPSIDILQSEAIDRGVRNPSGDYLVKAPVPAFVSVELTIRYRDGDAVPDANAIAVAVAARVNAMDFRTGILPAAVIHEAVNSVAGNNTYSVSPLEFFMQIRRPDGTVFSDRQIHGLTIPTDPARGVTSRTTCFFLAVTDVAVTVEKIPALPV